MNRLQERYHIWINTGNAFHADMNKYSDGELMIMALLLLMMANYDINFLGSIPVFYSIVMRCQ